MSLYCGAGKVSINPPKGQPLAGYMVKRPNIGIHDSVYARTFYIKQDDIEFLLIVLDLVAVDRNYVEKLREKIYSKFQIPREHVLVHATHTHSGPGGVLSSPLLKGYADTWGTYSAEFVENQLSKILLAVEEAISTTELCDVGYSAGEAKGIAANRISPEKEYEPKLQVIEFKKKSGKKIILYHFACHPTVLHANHLFVSADFPGTTSRLLESQESIECAIFLNGPCGDISTRFTRKESSFAEVERIGKALSGQVVHLLKNIRGIKMTNCIAKSTRFDLSIRKSENLGELHEKLIELKRQFSKAQNEGIDKHTLRELESRIEGVESYLQIAKSLKGITKINTEIQVLKIGPLLIITFPGEVFYETGQVIEKSIEKEITLLLGNTNDYIGYIVPPAYYDKSHYEASVTFLERDSEHKMKHVIKELLGGV